MREKLRLLMIDNYDSFTYNLKALILKVDSNISVDVIKNDEFIEASDYHGIILSPGPSSPQNSLNTLKYLNEYMGKKPFLGVCLGMQAICYTLGYNVRKAASIMHGKVDIMSVEKRESSILFKDMPESFEAVRYHSLVVEAPERFITAIAKSDRETMAIEMPEKKLFGVQFHPESFKSCYGDTIIRNFINFIS